MMGLSKKLGIAIVVLIVLLIAVGMAFYILLPGTEEEWPIPADKFIFIERWIEIYEDSTMSVYIDFPTYLFDQSSGELRPDIVPPGRWFPLEDLTELKLVYGRGTERTGSAGSGVNSKVFAVTDLPFTEPPKGDTDVAVTVERVDAQGVAYLRRGNEQIVLQPGESWTRDGKNIIEWGGVKSEISSRERISNFGVLDKSKIQVLKKTEPTPTPSPTPTPTPLYKVTALANTSADERYPIWSPDGGKIFFKSEDWISVCNPDGSQCEKLTEIEEDFVFSPDMKRVFYKKTVSNEGEVTYQAYVMDIDGKNREKIAELTLETKYVDDTGYIGHTRGPMYWMHSWSPDRTKIFFKKLEETGYTWVWREEEGKWKRYKAGTEPSIPVLQEEDPLWKGKKLIAKEHESTAWIWDLKDNELKFIGHLSYGIVHYNLAGEVVWSPDGNYVALPCSELSEAGETEQIFVVNVETGESKKLTSFVGANTWPEWSPDSKKITYVQVPPKYWWYPAIFDYDEGSDIWVVDIDGSNRKQLTYVPKNWEAGGWSPDGSKIAYTSQRVGYEHLYEIWVMNEDGSDKKLLVKGERVQDVRWSPDGSKMAFVAGKPRPGGLDRDIHVVDVPK